MQHTKVNAPAKAFGRELSDCEPLLEEVVGSLVAVKQHHRDRCHSAEMDHGPQHRLVVDSLVLPAVAIACLGNP
jgi:hypothetical protein